MEAMYGRPKPKPLGWPPIPLVGVGLSERTGDRPGAGQARPRDGRAAVGITRGAARAARHRRGAETLELREVPDLHGWMADAAARRSASPKNQNLQKLWDTLTADALTQWPRWREYVEGVDRRDRFVHEAGVGSSDEADEFREVAEELVEHFVDVLMGLNPAQ